MKFLKKADNKKNSQPFFKNGILLLLLSGFLLTGAYSIFIRLKPAMFQKQNSSLDIGDQTSKSTTAKFVYPTNAQISPSETYVWRTLKFTYPTSWKIFDSNRNVDFFDKYSNMQGKELTIALQKGSYVLLILVDKYMSGGGSIGGIFMSDEELNKFKNDYDVISIQGKPFFFSKYNKSLRPLQKSEMGYGPAASLIEYFLNRSDSEEGFDYAQYITNKSGYSYLFLTVTDDLDNNKDKATEQTPSNIQRELIQILQSISW